VSTQQAPANSKRVEYLERVYEQLASEVGAPLNATITVGWPSKSARSSKKQRLGECDPQALASGRTLLTVSHSACTDKYTACAVLIHEAIHAAHPRDGHKKEFATDARRMGLVGKLTASEPGMVAKQHIDRWTATLGEWPLESTNPPAEKEKKGSRLRKWVCECGVIARVASDDFKATCNECETRFEQQ